jgi:hypothetical protein
MPSGRIWEDEESEEILWTVVGIFTVSGLVLIIHTLLIHCGIHCGGTACNPSTHKSITPLPSFRVSFHPSIYYFSSVVSNLMIVS